MKIEAPKRAIRSGSFQATGSADTVLPLFCPVREVDWLESWRPGLVSSRR